jgi:hypothetical protein
MSGGMVKEAHELMKISSKIVIKVPMTPDGLLAVRALSLKTSVPMSLWYSPLPKPFWLQKREQPLFLRFLAGY